MCMYTNYRDAVLFFVFFYQEGFPFSFTNMSLDLTESNTAPDYSTTG